MILREKKAEMYASVAGWKMSSLTKSAYAQSVGISTSKFEYWVRKVRETNMSAEDYPGFVEVLPAPETILLPKVAKLPVVVPTPEPKAVLTFPSGLCLKIY